MDTDREKFERALGAYDAYQGLTLIDAYPCYASRVTRLAAHVFESRQPESNALRSKLIQSRNKIEMYKPAVEMREIEIDALKAELERLREQVSRCWAQRQRKKEMKIPEEPGLMSRSWTATRRSAGK